MCNAYNHPPGCNCGWGGGWSSRFGYFRGATWISTLVTESQADRFPPWLSSVVPAQESFTNPNASCPVCGVNVFYYQSPHGGRVFFDALGPPWPKHPCTDRRKAQNFIPERPLPVAQARYEWQEEGWNPFIVRELSAKCAGLKGPYFTVIHGTCEGVEIVTYIIEESLYERVDEDVERLLAHARFEDNASVSITFLDVDSNDFRVTGFYSLSDAKREYEERRYRSAKGRRPRRQQSAIGKALVDAIRNSGGSKKL